MHRRILRDIERSVTWHVARSLYQYHTDHLHSLKNRQRFCTKIFLYQIAFHPSWVENQNIFCQNTLNGLNIEYSKYLEFNISCQKDEFCMNIIYQILKFEYFLSGNCDWPRLVSGVSPSACCRLSWHSLILEKCKFLFPPSHFLGSIARIQIQTFRALSLKDCDWTYCITFSAIKKASE